MCITTTEIKTKICCVRDDDHHIKHIYIFECGFNLKYIIEEIYIEHYVYCVTEPYVYLMAKTYSPTATKLPPLKKN